MLNLITRVIIFLNIDDREFFARLIPYSHVDMLRHIRCSNISSSIVVFKAYIVLFALIPHLHETPLDHLLAA